MPEESEAVRKAQEIAWSVLPNPPEGKTYVLGKVWAESFRTDFLIPAIASALAERDAEIERLRGVLEDICTADATSTLKEAVAIAKQALA